MKKLCFLFVACSFFIQTAQATSCISIQKEIPVIEKIKEYPIIAHVKILELENEKSQLSSGALIDTGDTTYDLVYRAKVIKGIKGLEGDDVFEIKFTLGRIQIYPEGTEFIVFGQKNEEGMVVKKDKSCTERSFIYDTKIMKELKVPLGNSHSLRIYFLVGFFMLLLGAFLKKKLSK